jgi:hypothetical protein
MMQIDNLVNREYEDTMMFFDMTYQPLPAAGIRTT